MFHHEGLIYHESRLRDGARVVTTHFSPDTDPESVCAVLSGPYLAEDAAANDEWKGDNGPRGVV